MNPTRNHIRIAALAGAGSLILAAVSCTQYQQQGAALGALGGAALGAIAGDDGGDVVRGAAIGGAAGAGAAAIKEESDRRRGYYNSGGDNYRYQSQQTAPQQTAPPPMAPPGTKYPKATPSGTANLVISPYKPHNVIDVRGFQSGQLAKDPSNDQIFVVP